MGLDVEPVLCRLHHLGAFDGLFGKDDPAPIICQISTCRTRRAGTKPRGDSHFGLLDLFRFGHRARDDSAPSRLDLRLVFSRPVALVHRRDPAGGRGTKYLGPLAPFHPSERAPLLARAPQLRFME